MVFTQGRGFVLGALFGLPRRGHRLFGNVVFFGKLFGVAMLVGFGEKRCRKNLPLYASVERDRMQKRRGETLLDLLMSTVLPIVGGITAGLLLRSFTSLPFWACLLIGIPTGTVAAWVMFVGVAFLFHKAITEPLAASRERRKQEIRNRYDGP